MRCQVSDDDIRQMALRRAAARLIDLIVFFAFLVIVVSIDPPVWLGAMIVMAIYTVLDIWLPWYWGATIGKSLLRIRVTKINGEPQSFREMALRSFWVFSLGLACGVFALLPVTLGLSYRRMIEKGATLWDEWCGTDVQRI